MNTNQRIAEIIKARSAVAEKVDQYLAQWRSRQEKNRMLKSELSALRKVCLRAIAGSPQNNLAAFQELSAYLNEIDQKQLVHKLLSDCSYALEQLGKLEQRFNRKTLTIAVAGVGRCGKSTALKAIIGQSQDDNSTIPSGNGPAITAGKSTISCVATADEEKTVVRYHTLESFLNELINPLLQSISLSEHLCETADDFSALEYEQLREELDLKAKQALDSVKGAEIAVHQSKDRAAAELRLQQAKAYSSSFNLNYERLNHLHNIMTAFPHFRSQLNGGTDTVPLNQTYRYVSYPKSDEPAICYAVKECRIHSRFPNNEVQSLELTDLPGLGTGSQSEKKCFLDGFNYSTDLALMIRRPEGLFQNFTTEADLSVMKVLGATFGENHLHECMLMFQNDANLPQSDVERSYQRIEEWNRLRNHPLTVIRGNACDADFMQKTLLPRVLSFIFEKLPQMDQSLLDEILPRLERSAEETDELRSNIIKRLVGFKRLFPNNRGANAIYDRTIVIRNILLNDLTKLMNHYDNEFAEQDATLDNSVEQLTARIKSWVNTEYDPKNATLLEKVGNRIRANMSAIPYANQEIHVIRIHISEVYSELEKLHDTLIAEMQRSVADILRKCFPHLLAEPDGLDKFIELAASTGECPEIVDAVQTLNTLTVPFYNVIYPDLRKQVFDAVDKLERAFMLPADASQEKQAVVVLSELQNIGINWVWKAENMLYSESKITGIICAALERFLDRMIRNDETHRELIGFVEYFWSEIQNDNNACIEDVRTKLEKITE